MRPVPFLVGWALLLAACASPMPIATSTPSAMPASVAMGRPRGLASGARMSYWVWKDQDAVWHVRTTSAGVRHHFEGIVHPLHGTTIVNFSAIEHERDDEIGLIGGDIDIRFMPRHTVDGVDFQLIGPDALEFDLRIDNDGDPTHIRIGASQREPENAHFILSPG